MYNTFNDTLTFLRVNWVAWLTILIGIVPLSILSLATNSFWPHSSVPFPLLLSIPVAVGDSFFLPIFNTYFYKMLLVSKECIGKYKLHLIIATVIGIFVSFLINYWIHYGWCHDSYAGFTDFSYGSLSAAGWWHLVFATMESTVVILFFTSWIIFSRNNYKIFQMGLTGWKFLCGYFLLDIPDEIIKVSTVFKDLPFLDIIKIDWPIIPSLLFPFLMLFVVRKINRIS